MVDVLITTDTRYPVNRKLIRKAIADAFAKRRMVDMKAEISVVVIGKRKMKEISQKYLDDRENHEILTFPLEEVTGKDSRGFINVPDGILRLGDIILCWPKVLEAASEDDVLVDDEVSQLIIHGVAHLFGEHHET